MTSASYLPTAQDQAELLTLVRQLADQPSGTIAQLRLPGQVAGLSLSPQLLSLLSFAAQELADGHAVTVIPSATELSTTEAARLLGVSRPHLVNNLLETGTLPHHLVGTHRRIPLDALLAYQRDQEEHRAIADELSQEAQRLGLI